MIATRTATGLLLLLLASCDVAEEPPAQFRWFGVTCPSSEYPWCFVSHDGRGVAAIVHPAYHGSMAWEADYTLIATPSECCTLADWTLECYDGPNGPQCFGEHVDAPGRWFPVSCELGVTGLLDLAPYNRGCNPQPLASSVSAESEPVCESVGLPCVQTVDGVDVHTLPMCAVL